MTYVIGDPNHLGVHNDLVTAIGVQAARFGVTVTLPDTAHLGDTGHVDDHNLIVAALAAIQAAPDPGTPWVANATGGVEDTFIGDGTFGQAGVTYKRHTFTADGTFTNPAEGLAFVILQGGGGGGGGGDTTEMVGAGGAGGLLGRAGGQKVLLPAGALPVRVGVGGLRGLNGGPTSVGPVSVPGGGVGGRSRNVGGADGGCGGGSGDGTGVGGKGLPGVGYDGGASQGSQPDAGGGGGTSGPGTFANGGPGTNIWGTVYGTGGTVRASSGPPAKVAGTGDGGDVNQAGASGAGASGKAFIFYPA